MLCGTDNIMWNISVSISNIGIFYVIFLFPQKNGMDMDNVMLELFPKQGRDTRHGINRKAHLSLNAILLHPYIRCLTNYMIFLGVFTSWTMKSSHWTCPIITLVYIKRNKNGRVTMEINVPGRLISRPTLSIVMIQHVLHWERQKRFSHCKCQEAMAKNSRFNF